MFILRDEDLIILDEIVMIATNPKYIYTEFSKELIVQQIAKKYTVEQLVGYIRTSAVDYPQTNYKKILYLYLAIIALGNKAYTEQIKQIFDSINTNCKNIEGFKQCYFEAYEIDRVKMY